MKANCLQEKPLRLRHTECYMNVSQINWRNYINASPSEPHRTTKIAAKLLMQQAIVARCLDIGCGNGRDARFLASCGFTVTAIDSSPAAIMGHHESIRWVQEDVLSHSLAAYELINASLVLPFLPKVSFLELWPKLLESLENGGVIAGHFFGRQDWKVNSGAAWGCDENEVRQWLEPLQIEWLLSSEGGDANHAGDEVFKQTIAFVAMKKH